MSNEETLNPEESIEDNGESTGELDAEAIDVNIEDGEQAGGEVAQLQAELVAAQQKVEELTDQAVRSAAEQQNVRRRSERDVENAHKFGNEKFVKDLLAVVDSLERGMETIDPADEALKVAREGMALTLKMFTDVFVKQGVVELNPMGEPFDPQVHEAMSMVENPDAEPNSVMAVLQKGFTLNERLVRPAMVVVAKAPAAK